jgi:hypothetical protein
MKIPTIETLRKSGNKVRVIHRGRVPKDREQVNTDLLANDGFPEVTQIDVTFRDGVSSTGYAYRARGDNYNRKLGNMIALGRALKAANFKYSSLFSTTIQMK